MIVVEDLAKRFGEGVDAVDAVRGVTFEVAPGEIFGLLGPNGAGKSTTILILATLLRPTGGRASVAGYDVVDRPGEVRRAIGVTLQETGLDDFQRGREILEFHGRLYGLGASAASARARELIELVDLEDAAERKLGTYSGGMRRRLDLALTLVHSPRLVYLDEPTTGLDPASRRAIWGEITKLKASGVTVLLTTQYLEEADRLADRVSIIDDGLLAAEGPPEELKRQLGGDVVEIMLADHETAARAAVAIGGDEVVVDEQVVRWTTPDGASRVPELVAALQRDGIDPSAISVSRPTLDDVFLHLTGRRLERDDASGEADGA